MSRNICLQKKGRSSQVLGFHEGKSRLFALSFGGLVFAFPPSVGAER